MQHLQAPIPLVRMISSDSDRTLAHATSVEDYDDRKLDGPQLRNRSTSPHDKTHNFPSPTNFSLAQHPIETTTTSLQVSAERFDVPLATPTRLIAQPHFATLSHTNLAIPAAGVIVHHGLTANPSSYVPEDDVTIKPTSPQEIMQRRYDIRHLISERFDEDEVEKIPAMHSDFKHESPHPQWTPMTHPEGQLYFRKEGPRGIRICTDVMLQDPDKLEQIDTVAEQLLRKVVARTDAPGDLEITLDVRREEDRPAYYYYLSSLEKRAVLWLEEVDVDLVTFQLRQVFNLSYIQQAIKAQFWLHVTLYPNDHRLSEKILAEVNEESDFMSFDAKTSESSTSPYDYQDLTMLSNILRNLNAHGGARAVWVVARFMHVLTWEKFIHYHGQREARLDRERSLYEGTRCEASLVFSFLSMLLFYQPLHYKSQLQKIWVDQTVNHVPWKKFITNLQRDWEISITPAAVLLTANVGLLAVNTIDPSGSTRNVAEVACYVSTFFSLGNIALCSILARQYRMSGMDTAEGASQYLARREAMIAGLDSTAIAFSLPSALFLWGMGTFYIAVAWVCFAGSNLSTKILTGFTFTLVTSLVAIVIYMEWRPGDDNTAFRQFFAAFKRDGINLTRPRSSFVAWRLFTRRSGQRRQEDVDRQHSSSSFWNMFRRWTGKRRQEDVEMQ